MIYIFWFLFGFVLGILFIEILERINKFLYRNSEKGRKKDFSDEYDISLNDLRNECKK